MVYRAIGLMSGSSLDGLDIAFISFEEIRGNWSFDLRHQKCVSYPAGLKAQLVLAASLTPRDFIQLDHDLGVFYGTAVKNFIEEHMLDHQVQLIVNHGHTIFHEPQKGITTQIGSSAAIAAINSINVIGQLRSLDVALGGQGAPLVPMGEKHLFTDYSCFLNLGGIANIAFNPNNQPEQGRGASARQQAFDVTICNQALNYLAGLEGLPYDKDGQIAAAGKVDTGLLTALNRLGYFTAPAPKSLANQFFSEVIRPLLDQAGLPVADKLNTVVAHIAGQIAYAAGSFIPGWKSEEKKILITGGGAHNTYLIARISAALAPYGIQASLPKAGIIDYKEAIIMGFLGVLRWREENTVLESTGASRPSIGGAVWIGQTY